MLPKVAIVGRANVGKSTLFNRLTEQSKALVSDIAGTTRDTNNGIVFWQGKNFELIDTGGLDIDKKNTGKIEKNIVRKAKEAADKADLILFTTDLKAGLLPTDKLLAKELKQKITNNKIILVGNKGDNERARQNSGELYKLALGEPVLVSAANGSGTGDLLDEIVKQLPKTKFKTNSQTDIIKIAIVGKPNAGKSSLLNSILGEERVIVTDIAHTTRESHDSEFKYKNNNFILIDTAGIRKKYKGTRDVLEKKSVDRSIQTISQADIVFLVTEANKHLTAQDKKIGKIIEDNKKSVIIVANKWDLIPDKDDKTIEKYIDYYRSKMPYLWWAPLIFVSAKENTRSRKILDMAIEIKKARQTTISDKALENFMKNRVKKMRPSRKEGLKNPYIYQIKQAGINPPRFNVLVDKPKIVQASYLRYLQNGLREKFNIMGTPIHLELKKWIKNKK